MLLTLLTILRKPWTNAWLTKADAPAWHDAASDETAADADDDIVLSSDETATADAATPSADDVPEKPVE